MRSCERVQSLESLLSERTASLESSRASVGRLEEEKSKLFAQVLDTQLQKVGSTQCSVSELAIADTIQTKLSIIRIKCIQIVSL